MALVEITTDETALITAAMTMTVRLGYEKMTQKDADNQALLCAGVITHLNEARLTNLDVRFIIAVVRKMLEYLNADTKIPKSQRKAVTQRALFLENKLSNALDHPSIVKPG